MRYKIYASDEGFGHLVRQQAIHQELSALCPEIAATLQTNLQIKAARNLFGDIDYLDRFNNITWSKSADGTPDLDEIRRFFTDYDARARAFIDAEEGLGDFRFVISDLVYEAFPVAARSDVPAFGVAHFTWDWFFSKLYPLPVATSTLEQMREHAALAKLLFFPPFTPSDILNAYADNAKAVPLIVRARQPDKQREVTGKFNVLVMDSGTRLLSAKMNAALNGLHALPDIHFYLPAHIDVQGDNVTRIGADELFLDYMPFMDLVVARAGFNTISECVAYRTPMLLIGEALNPEMDMNMLLLKQQGLASFISLDSFTGDFRAVLYDFIDNEYKSLKQAMETHDIASDGARVVAEEILNFVAG